MDKKYTFIHNSKPYTVDASFSEEVYKKWSKYFAVFPRLMLFPWMYRVVDASRTEPEFLALVEKFKTVTEGFSDKDRITSAIYLCRSPEYQTDLVTNGMLDYWSTAIETLYLGTGDCEDKAILICAFLNELGYDTCLIYMKGHMACGVVGDFTGDFVEFNGKKYYYIESTASLKVGVKGTIASSHKLYPVYSTKP